MRHVRKLICFKFYEFPGLGRTRRRGPDSNGIPNSLKASKRSLVDRIHSFICIWKAETLNVGHILHLSINLFSVNFLTVSCSSMFCKFAYRGVAFTGDYESGQRVKGSVNQTPAIPTDSIFENIAS